MTNARAICRHGEGLRNNARDNTGRHGGGPAATPAPRAAPTSRRPTRSARSANAAPRGFAAREASDVAWALAAARGERLLPPAATDNATVADVAAFLDRLADHARSVSYAPRDVATALWACAKIAEAVASLWKSK